MSLRLVDGMVLYQNYGLSALTNICSLLSLYKVFLLPYCYLCEHVKNGIAYCLLQITTAESA